MDGQTGAAQYSCRMTSASHVTVGSVPHSAWDVTLLLLTICFQDPSRSPHFNADWRLPHLSSACPTLPGLLALWLLSLPAAPDLHTQLLIEDVHLAVP